MQFRVNASLGSAVTSAFRGTLVILVQANVVSGTIPIGTQGHAIVAGAAGFSVTLSRRRAVAQTETMSLVSVVDNAMQALVRTCTNCFLCAQTPPYTYTCAQTPLFMYF